MLKITAKRPARFKLCSSTPIALTALAFMTSCGGDKKSAAGGEPAPEAGIESGAQPIVDDDVLTGVSGGSIGPTPPSTNSPAPDTTPPAPPVVTDPAVSSVLSKLNDLTIAGTCEADSTVNLAGDATATQSCAGGTFTFAITKTADAVYSFTVSASDTAGNASAASTISWTRDTVAPGAPTLVSPPSPYTSGNTTLTITGACEAGTTVELSGDDTASAACVGGSYALAAVKNADGAYNFTLRQTDAAANISSATALQWTRDTAVPASPTISAPASAPHYTNSGTLVVSGGCITGYVVTLSGVDSGDVTSPAGSLTQTCAANLYSYTILKTVDGSYTLNVHQTNLANNNASASVSRVWVYDSVPPGKPVISGPLPNPYTSGDNSVTITGTCATNTTVDLSGAATDSQACSGGGFSFVVAKGADGTYAFNLAQTDLAGNLSESTPYTWVRDTTIPATPTISSPASATTYSNGGSFTIAGDCVTGYEMTLSGDVVAADVSVPTNSLTVACASNAYTYTINKSVDGTYAFAVTQTNTTTGLASGSVSRTWARDVVAPAAPAVSSPSSSPYTAPGNLTITSDCELNATVNLSGDATDSALCATGFYSFTVVQNTDATYNFTIGQTDRASNSSSTTAVQWIRNSASLAPPTIANPATPSVTSNIASMTVSGACTRGLSVVLGGDIIAADVTSPASSLSMECSVSATYSFVIGKSSDGTFNFNLLQTDGVVSSATVNLTWTLDREAPTLTVSAAPPNNNPSLTARFVFSSNDASAVFNCKLNAGAYSDCLSPVALTSLPNNVDHTYSIRAVDAAGNFSAVYTYTWQQDAYATVALYKFDDPTPGPTVDSSLYSAATLTDNGTSIAGSAKFDQSRQFTDSSTTMTAASHSKLDLLADQMTVEGWFNFAALPSNGTYVPLIMRSGASDNYSWYIRLKKHGGSTQLRVAVGVSSNGTTWVEKESSSKTGLAIDTWYHVAVTFDRGTAKVFLDGTSYGTLAVGSAASFKGTGGITIGGANAGAAFNGRIDDLRLSQTLRYSGAFTPPASAYDPSN